MISRHVTNRDCSTGYAFPPAAWPGQLISTATVIRENYHFQVIIGGETVPCERS